MESKFLFLLLTLDIRVALGYSDVAQMDTGTQETTTMARSFESWQSQSREKAQLIHTK